MRRAHAERAGPPRTPRCEGAGGHTGRGARERETANGIRIARRALLTGLAALCGCPPAAEAPHSRGIHLDHLEDALGAVGLGWLLLVEPETIHATPWLAPALGRMLRDERLDLFAAATGVDLRQVPELALASYPASAPPSLDEAPADALGEASDATFLLCRTQSDPLAVERLFRERLTTSEHRSVAAEGVIHMSGNVGRKPQAFVAIGDDVVGFQYGGSRERGPARIAALLALDMLHDVPPALAPGELGPLARALGGAPLRALLPGPFEGPLARGARGLFGAALAVGAALSPTAGQTLQLDVVLVGDYAPEPARAAGVLTRAWHDVAASDLGHLLGIDAPVTPPTAAPDGGGLRLRAELDAAVLLDGLAAATVDNVRDILR